MLAERSLTEPANVIEGFKVPRRPTKVCLNLRLKMKGKRNLAWVILALLIGSLAIFSFQHAGELQSQRSGGSTSEGQDFLIPGEKESNVVIGKSAFDDGVERADSKTPRPRKILSEVELEIAKKSFEKIRERYQPAHPVYLDAEQRVAELQEMVNSSTE